MSDYADGAEAMRKAILARFAELESEWRKLRDTYDPRGQYDDRMIATQEIEGYKTATGIVRGIILEDRRSMVCENLSPAIDLGLPYNDPPQPPGVYTGGRSADPNRHSVDCGWITDATSGASIHICKCGLEDKRRAAEGASSAGDSSVARTTALDYSDPDDAAYGAGFEAMREKAAELWATFGGDHKFIELLNEVQP